jgi:hypothetical protein
MQKVEGIELLLEGFLVQLFGHVCVITKKRPNVGNNIECNVSNDMI